LEKFILFAFCPFPPLCNVDQTQVCILPFSNIERGNGGATCNTCSVGIVVMISGFCAFSNTICPWLYYRMYILVYLNITWPCVTMNCTLHDVCFSHVLNSFVFYFLLLRPYTVAWWHNQFTISLLEFPCKPLSEFVSIVHYIQVCIIETVYV